MLTCSHISIFFLVMILLKPKQEVKRESEWFLGCEGFHSNFKLDPF